MKNEVIIHCSATKPSQYTTAAVIKYWHLKNGWRDIGYHWVIERDGTLVKGRDGTGAHTRGHNDTIGVCLIGGVDENMNPECNFTLKQWVTLNDLIKQINPDKVSGHNQYSSKACPSFNASYLLGE